MQARPLTCQDKYEAIPGHTMCLANVKASPSNSSGINQITLFVYNKTTIKVML